MNKKQKHLGQTVGLNLLKYWRRLIVLGDVRNITIIIIINNSIIIINIIQIVL